MRLRRRETLSWRIKRNVIETLIFPFRLIYDAIAPILALRASRRAYAELCSEVRIELGHLMQRHRGKIIEQRIDQPTPFSYATVVVSFPDREIVFVRGRSEFYVQVDGVEVFLERVETPGRSEIFLSVLFLDRHWEELPGVTAAEVARWQEKARQHA